MEYQNQKPGLSGPQVYYGQPEPQVYGQQTGGYGQAQTSDVKVVIEQPQQQTSRNKLLVTNIEGQREWTTGLFDCLTDIGSCLFTMCCYSCAICKLASRTGECFCTPMCVPVSDIIIRTRIRTLGGIRGSLCQDCLTVTCCPMCTACQEARELTNMGVP